MHTINDNKKLFKNPNHDVLSCLYYIPIYYNDFILLLTTNVPMWYSQFNSSEWLQSTGIYDLKPIPLLLFHDMYNILIATLDEKTTHNNILLYNAVRFMMHNMRKYDFPPVYTSLYEYDKTIKWVTIIDIIKHVDMAFLF